MAQFVYFAALLVLCGTGDSLETVTSPQHQNTGDNKDLCEKSISTHAFPGIPGSNGMPGMPSTSGPQGPQGREGAKGQTGDKGSQGMLGQKGEKGNEAPRGKSGPPGMMGIKGARGIAGDRGIKGDKGEKGQSVTSPSSAVPQTNWKQCVWKNLNNNQDNGKVKECSFNKLQAGTAMKVSFQGNMRVQGTSHRCNRWFFKFNGNECSGTMTIEAVVYNYWPSGNPSLLHH